MRLAPSIEPTPSTVEGTRSMVERFHALNRPEVGVGGVVGGGSVTSLVSLPSKKSKSQYRFNQRGNRFEPNPVVWNGKRPSKDKRYDGPEIVAKRIDLTGMCQCEMVPPHTAGWHEALAKVDFSMAQKTKRVPNSCPGCGGETKFDECINRCGYHSK